MLESFYTFENCGFEPVIEHAVKCDVIAHDVPEYHGMKLSEVIDQANYDIAPFTDWLCSNYDPFEVMNLKLIYNHKCDRCETIKEKGGICPCSN